MLIQTILIQTILSRVQQWRLRRCPESQGDRIPAGDQEDTDAPAR